MSWRAEDYEYLSREDGVVLRRARAGAGRRGDAAEEGHCQRWTVVAGSRPRCRRRDADLDLRHKLVAIGWSLSRAGGQGEGPSPAQQRLQPGVGDAQLGGRGTGERTVSAATRVDCARVGPGQRGTASQRDGEDKFLISSVGGEVNLVALVPKRLPQPS